MKDVAVVIFHPPSGETESERLVDEARRASCRDLIANVRRAGLEPIVVTTPSGDGDTPFTEVEQFDLPATSGPFHFGESLKYLLAARRPEGLVYFGSGSGFLLSPSRIERLIGFAGREEAGAVLNNFYSCDFTAVSHARALLDLDLPVTDNRLGFVLSDAGLPCWGLERRADTQFDIDTPTDLHVLGASERGGPDVRTFLRGLDSAHPSLDALLALFRDRSALVGFVGRISPRTWADVERDIACRTSSLAEGRGMRAGTANRPTVLHQALLESGPEAFFVRLSRAYDGALIDTRPLLSGGAELPPANVRFESDLLRPEKIADRRWRSFTECALTADIPVVLGGHNLLSGGLYVLAEASWKGRDLARRLHPEPFDPDKERS